ncbi:hypothetical protein Pcinc_001719 [Petrolisthes cinctipes]|nr:hypothetical protein Pcinc_001719 [Petrolisthes cinctipes]
MTSIDLDIPSRHQIPPEILASQTPMDPLRQINTLDSLKEILLIADSLTDVPKLLPDDTLPPPHIINTTTSLDLSYLQDPSLLPQTTRRTSKEKLQTVRVTSGEATTTSLLPSTKKSISSKDLFQLFYSDRKQVPADVTNVSPNAIQEGDREKLVHFLLHGKQVNDSNRQKDLTETKLRPTVITNQQITSQTFFHEHKGTDNRHSDQPPSMSVSEGELSPAFNPSERLTEDGPCGFQTPTTHTTESPTSSLKSGQNMYESSQNMHGSDQSMYGSGSTAPVTQKSRLYEPATDSQTTINAVTTLPENAATYRVEGRSISDTDGIVRIRRWPIPQRGAKNSFLAVRRRRGDNGHSRNRKMNLPAYFQL